MPFGLINRTTARFGKDAPSGDPPTGTPPVAPAKGDPTPITFTTEQLDKVNGLVGNARTEGRTAGEKAAQAALLKELGVASVDDLKAALTKPAPKPGETPKPGAADPDAVKAALEARDGEWKPKLTAAEERAAAAEKKYADMVATAEAADKRALLTDAGTKAKAVDPAIVAQLTDPFVVKNDAGKWVVMGENGPRLNDKGDPMSPAEFVAAFIAERPYLAAPSGTGGGGSGPNVNHGNATVAELQTQHKAALAAGNTVLAVSLNRQITELQNKKTG